MVKNYKNCKIAGSSKNPLASPAQIEALEKSAIFAGSSNANNSQ